MAVLEKIRKRTVFLILVIGLALFAFVISGIFNSPTTRDQLVIGSVNGDKISYMDFSTQVENTMRNMGGGISQGYIVNALWEQAVQSRIIDQQFEKLGISISKEQVIDMISKVPSYAQNPQFQDEKGAFSAPKFAQFISELKTMNPTVYKQWQAEEKSYIDNAKRETYLNLIRSALGVTFKDGENEYHKQSDQVSLKYVAVPYASIADSLVKVSDKEIEDYIKAHKKQFEQKQMRNLQFVLASNTASAEDIKGIEEALKALDAPKILYNANTGKNDTLPGFATIPKREVPDFVNDNSDVPFDSLYVSREKLFGEYAEALYNLEVGQLYGPYKEDNAYKYSRMLAKKPNAEVRASHILIAYKGSMASKENTTLTKEEAKAKAEGLLARIKAGEDFATLAQANSDDSSNAPNGGDLNFFTPGTMVPAFNDYVFSAKVGDVGLVETDFGFHVVKITDQKAGVQLATIVRNIAPSSATINQVYTNITAFNEAALKNPKDFAAIATKQGYSVLPANNLEALAEDIPGLGSNRQVVKWAFEEDTKVGDIHRFDVKDGYVVAQLTKKIKEGLAAPDDVRAIVEPILIKEKKVKQITEKMKGTSLEQIAQATGQTNNIQLSENVTLASPIIAGQGNEPSVVGVAFVLPENKLSKPIAGNNGVYVIEVTQKTIAPAINNYTTYSNNLRNQKINRASQDLSAALQSTAKIVDDRAKYY